MILSSVQAEDEALLNVAKLMVAAARTAPKARGDDSIKTAIVTGSDKDELFPECYVDRRGEHHLGPAGGQHLALSESARGAAAVTLAKGDASHRTDLANQARRGDAR